MKKTLPAILLYLAVVLLAAAQANHKLTETQQNKLLKADNKVKALELQLTQLRDFYATIQAQIVEAQKDYTQSLAEIQKANQCPDCAINPAGDELIPAAKPETPKK